MASAASSVSQQYHHQQQQQQQGNGQYKCKDCGLNMNSAESLDVHVKYHKENLLNHWGPQPSVDEANNNKIAANIKREFNPDSTDVIIKRSPDYGSRTSPENSANFGHPATPQSFHSGSSPYQNVDSSNAFSPNFQNYQSIKTEPTSPSSHFQGPPFTTYPPENQFYAIDNSQTQVQPSYSQEYPVLKTVSQASGFRYHPYSQNSYDPTSQTQTATPSPSFVNQSTSSPNPKQCDKCGYVCDTDQLLLEHVNLVHPSTTPHLTNFQQQSHFMFPPHEIKTEEDTQSEILDLDSHKVHQVYQEEEKRHNGESNGLHAHSVSAMLSAWPHPQQAKFQPDQQGLFMGDQKLFQNGMVQGVDSKSFQQDPKLFHGHQVHAADYLRNGVVHNQENITNSMVSPQQHPYRAFEHLPPQPSASVITSTQVTNNPPAVGSGKGANWKSNEARRPKTYNCTACNKWFTSSGHLKRHYNTTLHKNAVKSSGHPDPANLPISAHHHPGRESGVNRSNPASENSPDQIEDSRNDDGAASFERSNSLAGLIQQQPNVPYDSRQPPANLHGNQALHSPLGHNPAAIAHGPLSSHNNLTNLPNSNSPNGEAGPSALSNYDTTRGLLTLHNSTGHPFGTQSFNMAPMIPMDSSHFQMYPNGSAPRVMQVMAINSLNITGENAGAETIQPLPSFSQFQQAQRYNLTSANADVGGADPATGPYGFMVDTTAYDMPDHGTVLVLRPSDDSFRNAYILPADEAIQSETIPYSPPNHNNNRITTRNLQEFSDLSENCDPDGARIASEVRKTQNNQTKSGYEDAPLNSSTVSTTTPTTQPGTYRCDDCDKVFNKACYLTQHNKTFHSGDKPFKCSRCGKRFASQELHEEHHAKHAGEKPHKCKICPKQFNHKTDLRRHSCIHTGTKPYACSTCGKGFIRKDHMIKHGETHLKKASNNSLKTTTVR